jgi:hypothetical protein
MKTNRIFALLLVAVMLLSTFTGCNTVEPGTTNPSGSIGSADHTGTDGTDSTTGADDPTGTTGSNPAGDETISGTETTEPNNPTTEPSEPTTKPSEPTTQPTTPETKPTQPSECSHDWSDWTTKKAATCTEDGSEERKCSKCGEKEQRAATATGHSYGSWSTTKQATCDTNGVKTRKCSKCSKEETETIAATGHNWDEGKVTTTPTSCSDMGIKTYTCKTCGKTKTEQIKGSHTFGEWKYEEYTYKQDGYDRVSHRKVRTCTKCGYKEYGNTPDHSCKKGSSNHTVTTIKEGTCTTPAKMRSTCKICGWYVDYDGKKGSHTIKTETRHLTDYGAYTNELDARIDTCTSCGATDTVYIKGEGWSDYNRYAVSIALTGGDNFSLEHPEYQTVKRNFVYDSNGYVKQFTVYWWYNGQRYSQVINCDKASMIAWFAEYGMTATGSETFQIKASGTKVQPYKISWTG